MAYNPQDEIDPRIRRAQPQAKPMPQKPMLNGGKAVTANHPGGQAQIKTPPGKMKPTLGGGLQSPGKPKANPMPGARKPQMGGAGSSSGPIVDPAEIQKRVGNLPGLSDMQRKQLLDSASRGPGAFKNAVAGQPFEQDAMQVMNAATGAAQNDLGGFRPSSAAAAPPGGDVAPPPGGTPPPPVASGALPGNVGGGGTGPVSAPPSGVPQGGITSVWNPQAREKMAAERGWGFVQQVQDAMSAATANLPQGTGARQQAIYGVLQQFGLTGGSGVPQGQPPGTGTTQTPPIMPPTVNPSQNPPATQTPPIYIPPEAEQVPATQIPDIFLPF